jgi:hypothetical protein
MQMFEKVEKLKVTTAKRWIVARVQDGRQLKIVFLDKQRAAQHALVVSGITKTPYTTVSFIGDKNEINA